MVSFSCEACGDILTKKKLDPHRSRCRGATFTCIDCMVYFPGTEYRAHTSCMTEDQKYQGALYKPKKQKSSHSVAQTVPSHQPESSKRMSQQAYVEDVTEGYEAYRDYEIHDSDYDDSKSPVDLLPEAPTPPPAVENVNVFDYMVAGATPNASNLDLQRRSNSVQMSESTQLVRYDQEANGYVDQSGYMIDEEGMVHYGAGPIHSSVHFETPAPKERRKKDGETKKDKKRKRLHIETNSPLAIENGPGDQAMTDAPPELHSGLTGGLNRMLRPSQFPPSPDYSGGDAGENSPASPIKKSKHSKSSKPSRTESFGNNLKALMSGSSKSTKVSKKRKHSHDKKEKKRHHHRSEGDKAQKLIEFRPQTADGKDAEGQMVVFKPRSELFLSMCTKGPESERGYSMNKALKRFHRERNSSGLSLGKPVEEKELWRSLRMRKNDRGEIVLFSV